MLERAQLLPLGEPHQVTQLRLPLPHRFLKHQQRNRSHHLHRVPLALLGRPHLRTRPHFQGLHQEGEQVLKIRVRQGIYFDTADSRGMPANFKSKPNRAHHQSLENSSMQYSFYY